MKAKEVILLILILIAGISFYYIYTGKVYVDFDEVEGLRFTTREKFTFEEAHVLEAPLPGLLKVINSYGDIDIFGSEDNTATVFFEKEIWRKKEEHAFEFSEKILLTINREKNHISLSSNRNELNKHNFRTHFRIYLPQQLNVEVENDYGLARVSGVENAWIKNRYGRVVASDINGNLYIRNSHKDVDVENIHGNVELDSKYSSLFLKNISGETDVTNKYGKIEIENAKKKVEIDSPYTNIHGQDLLGRVKLNNSYRKIYLLDTGPTKITGYHSSIEIEKAKGDVEITNDRGKASFTNIEGNLIVRGKSLTIDGRKIVGDKISLTTSYKDINLIESSGNTTITIAHGDLTLEPSDIIHPIKVAGDYADITFYWPRGKEFPFEVRAKNGEIKWKLPAEISSWEDNHTTTLKAFLKAGEKPLVFMSTSYGNILVEEY